MKSVQGLNPIYPGNIDDNADDDVQMSCNCILYNLPSDTHVNLMRRGATSSVFWLLLSSQCSVFAHCQSGLKLNAEVVTYVIRNDVGLCLGNSNQS